MSRRTISILLILSTASGVLLVMLGPAGAQVRPGTGGAPLPNNPFPPSFYGYSSSYYGPYYPGQYQYGGVDPRVYNNYTYPRAPSYDPRLAPIEDYRGHPQPSYSFPNYLRFPTESVPPLNDPRLGSGRNVYRPVVTKNGSVQNSTVLMEVRVPDPAAEVWVEGHKTRSTGTRRQFESPPLVPGTEYTYTFRARWFESGREVTQSRQVDVRAAERITIDLTAPARHK